MMIRIMAIMAASVLSGEAMVGYESLTALLDKLVFSKYINMIDLESALSLKLDAVESDEYYSIFEKKLSEEGSDIKFVEYRAASKIASSGDIANIFLSKCVLEQDIINRYSPVKGRVTINSGGVSTYFYKKTNWGRIVFDFSGSDNSCLKSVTIEVKKRD